MSMTSPDKFFNVLHDDVQAAIARHFECPTDISAREVARSVFIAIEGASWRYRLSVIDAARTLDVLRPEEEFALSEKSYSVSSTGKISEQPRFLPLLASFRLTERIASRISTAAAINFEVAEWSGLHRIVQVRHAITHPKSISDLEIDEKTTRLAVSSLEWLLAVIAESLDAVNGELREFTMQSKVFFERLKQGDPEALRLYAAIKTQLDNES